jgi:hypothetical protein
MNRESLIKLRRALAFAEKELGLNTLSETEKQLYYAAVENADDEGNFLSDKIRHSEWCSDIPHATYHRLLSQLINYGIFEKTDGSQRNRYAIAQSKGAA